METLFALEFDSPEPPPVAGLELWRQYITEDEEARLAARIDALAWDTKWERRRQLYGYSYGSAQTAPPPIPDWGIELAERMQRAGVTERRFDQMLVNEYLPGQGIAMHRDYDPFDRTVVSLSLLSACVMDFRHVATKARESLLLDRRSLLILSDEARYDWEHGIARRKKDRWHGLVIPRARRLSVTFRLSKSST